MKIPCDPNQFICVASGPNWQGDKEFDKQCVFGNDMYLNEMHVSWLTDFCDPKFPPAIKYYVCKMTYSSVVENKCKMVM